MLLRIETFKSAAGADHVAVVAGENELLSSGACAAAASERGAIVEAINAYFNKGTELQLDPDPLARLPQPLKRRASTPAQLRLLIEETVGEESTIEYEDRNGSITTRPIVPVARFLRPASAGFPEDYLLAEDVEKGEQRTFRLDRIHWMETK